MDIYIKTQKKASIKGKKTVYLKDIAEVFAPEQIAQKLKSLEIVKVQSQKQTKILVSIVDVVKIVSKAFPDYSINSLGEMDTVIEYSPTKKKDNVILSWAKVALVSLVLFAGASTAIMSFHSDAQIPTVFKNYYYIFFRETDSSPWLIDIPYSVGLAVGIMVFFNHFFSKKMTNDPTPIEVEMSLYEDEVTDTVIDALNVKQTEGKEGKK